MRASKSTSRAEGQIEFGEPGKASLQGGQVAGPKFDTGEASPCARVRIAGEGPQLFAAERDPQTPSLASLGFSSDLTEPLHRLARDRDLPEAEDEHASSAQNKQCVDVLPTHLNAQAGRPILRAR